MKRLMIITLTAALLIMLLLCSCVDIRNIGLRHKESAGKPVQETAEPTPDGTPVDGLSSEYMTFSQVEKDMIYSLWPLKRYPMEYFGTLHSFNVDVDADGCWLFVMFDLDKPYEETEKALMQYLDGDWEKDDDGASVIVFTADGGMISCVLDKTYGVALECLVEPAPRIKEIVDVHWPLMFRPPGGLSQRGPEFYGLTIYPDSEDAELSGEWSISPGEMDQVNSWIRKDLKISEYVPGEIDGSRLIGDINVSVRGGEDSVSITIRTGL